MSISKFQEKFLGKSCGVVVGIAMALVFLGLGFTQCGRGQGGNSGDEAQAATIATVGGIPVTTNDLTSVQKMLDQDSQGAMAYTDAAREHAKAIYAAASNAANAFIAQRDHIPINDNSIIQAAQGAVRQQIVKIEVELASMKKLQNPTQAQKDALFKAQMKQTPEQAVDASVSNIKGMLADKDQRAGLMLQMLPQIVNNAIAAKINVTDAELRSNYDTYGIKRIFLSSAKNANMAVAASNVEAALKGGMPFESAMDKFSNDPPQPGSKKVGANIVNVPAGFMDMEPEYKMLKGKPAGFVSGPTDVPAGKAIFKVVSVINNAPKDFQANIAQNRTEYATEQAQTVQQKEIQDVLSGPSTKWQIPGYKALFEAFEATTPIPGSSPPSLQKVIDDAKAARSGPEGSQIPATDAWFLAFNQLYNAPGADKAKMRDDRIDLLNAVLQSNEDFDLRMELVDLYIQKKDGQDAIDQLSQAAESNTVYDRTGQRRFGDIGAKRDELLKLGLAKEADLASIDNSQQQWVKSKAESDAENAEMKKEEASQKAADAQLEKQNAAKIQEEKAQAPSAPSVPSAPSGSPESSKPTSNGSKARLTPPGLVNGK